MGLLFLLAGINNIELESASTGARAARGSWMMLGTSELLEKCFLFFLSLSFCSKEPERSLRVGEEMEAGGQEGLGAMGCSCSHRGDQRGNPRRLFGAWICPKRG